MLTGVPQSIATMLVIILFYAMDFILIRRYDKQRQAQVGNERRDKYVTEEFLTQVVYGCHVVITKPTSAPQKLDVLLQGPRGAMAVLNGLRTRSIHVALDPYHTWTTDYFFYFPRAGTFLHFPVHVAKEEKLLAFAPPVPLKAVDTPSKVDPASWDHISQHGTEEEVLRFLEENNLGSVKLDRMAWRMRDRAFFDKAISRGQYDYVWQENTDLPKHAESLKLDWNLNATNTLTGSFNRYREDQTGAAGITTSAGNWPQLENILYLWQRVKLALDPEAARESALGLANNYTPIIIPVTPNRIISYDYSKPGFIHNLTTPK